MPAYTAYGLRIESDILLPDLISDGEQGSAPDVVVRRGGVDISPGPGGDEICRRASAEEICIHYDGVASLLIERGARVTIDIAKAAPAGLIRLVMLGPALGVILHQRGFLVLHASAVRIGLKAVAFIGDKGAGKSTTAGAFHARGHALIADDVLAVTPGTFLVYPAFPVMKLWSQSAEHLRGRADDLEQFHPRVQKFAVPAAERFAAEPCRLTSVFCLSDADEVSIEKLPPQQAVIELLRNSYLRLLLRQTESAASHLRQIVALAGAMPVCMLKRPRSLPSLDALVSAVVAHVG